MYKTILVHIDETARSAQRAEVASQLALLHDAHLVGAAMTGLPAYLLPAIGYEPGFDGAALVVADLRAEAGRSLDAFEAVARRAGVASIERRCLDEEPGMGMSLQARYADVAVISQSDLDEVLPRVRPDFPDYLVLNAPHPVLVLPKAGVAAMPAQRITAAWDGSAGAARAITSALPLLRRARQVDLVVFDADDSDDAHGEQPGADMALYLARHGVRAEVSSCAGGREAAAALLDFATVRHADLIVMGAYGHSRFREILLGGMTRDVLASSPIALWMMH